MLTMIGEVLRDRKHTERGAAMVEYGLILLLIALAAFAAVGLFGIGVRGLFDDPRLIGALN